MLRVQSSRRAAGLQPSDYDHEIALVDDDAQQSPRPVSSNEGGVLTASTSTNLLSPTEEEHPEERQNGNGSRHQSQQDIGNGPFDDDADDNSRPSLQPSVGAPEIDHESSEHLSRPSIEIQAPSPDLVQKSHQSHRVKRRSKEARETVIDILYENERGGFLCGTALFSGAALGGLDAAPWTNVYHKVSPTTIHTAQVPDPSWEWVWPEWRINHQDGTDEGGWEYSFAYSKKFSWHGPKWWNSFVRRRAWIRRRARNRPEDLSVDPHMLNADYFTVAAASNHSHQSAGSIASGGAPSKASMAQTSTAGDEEKPDINDIDTLINILRHARIDREKREAVENYLEHGIDLASLQDEMHEIMSLFIFQASRRSLLCHLMHKHDETNQELEMGATPELTERKEALDGAIKHAEEEVRRLAYWSDIKHMAESGELRYSVDGNEGWHDAWQGLDRSAPLPPNGGKLPSTGK